jgi:NAD kinase
VYGKEIEFRANLENELRKGKSNIYYEACRNKRKRIASETVSGGVCETIPEEDEDNDVGENETQNEKLKTGLKKDTIPMILIVVQGGPGSLKTVEEAINQNVPILVLAVGNLIFY